MITYKSQKQLTLEGFETPFDVKLNADNRWVKLSQCIPWDELASGYYKNHSSTHGRPAKDARLVIGAVIIKHKLCLSDEETVQQIRENFYLQYFVGFPAYQDKQPFAPSLFVEIRRRMGEQTFAYFQQAIVNVMEKRPMPDTEKSIAACNHTDDEPPSQNETTSTCDEDAMKQDVQSVDDAATHQGRLILDATVAEQAIRFPTDLSLLNESREISERIIDVLHPATGAKAKPRTYRQTARKDYLAILKQRRPKGKKLRAWIKKQLQYLRRNFQHIEQLLDVLSGRVIPLSYSLLRKYWIIQNVVSQQEEMLRFNCKRCDNRIVSIHQPHVRPIVRGKANKAAEFGAKLSVSLTPAGIASVDHISWDAFNEGGDLPTQVEAYKQRYGYYPQSVLGDRFMAHEITDVT
ncbi:MAG: IS5 family transposase [Candidatus Nitrotoga sp.]